MSQIHSYHFIGLELLGRRSAALGIARRLVDVQAALELRQADQAERSSCSAGDRPRREIARRLVDVQAALWGCDRPIRPSARAARPTIGREERLRAAWSTSRPRYFSHEY